MGTTRDCEGQRQKVCPETERLGPACRSTPPQVTLSPSARLDALAVNHYELQLQFTCGNSVLAGPLFVHVLQDSGRIRCAGPFASPGEARGGRGEGRYGLARTSLTSSLDSWGIHPCARDSHTWGRALHCAAARPQSPESPGKLSSRSGE